MIDLSRTAPQEPVKRHEPPPVPLEPWLPTVPVKSALSFAIDTREKEIALVELALTRLEAERTSLERSAWLKMRKIADLHFANNFDDRREPGSIYEHSNLSINLPKRYCSITAARAFDELLATDPMLAVVVDGDEDSTAEAEAIERMSAYKLAQAKIKLVFRESILTACRRGEAVIKPTWGRRMQRHKAVARVLINEQGEVVRMQDGNPVIARSAWSEPDEQDVRVLRKDPKIKVTGTPRFEDRMVEFRKIVYSGLTVKVVALGDFYCGLTESCVQEADWVAHVFDWELPDVTALWAEDRDTLEAQWADHLVRNTAMTRAGAEGGTQAHAKEVNEERGEQGRVREAMPVCNVAEIYMRVAIEEDGQPDEIVMLIDTESRQPLFYDYLANYSATGKRPFRVQRIHPVPERWYGAGYYEVFKDRHKFCDLMLNRVNFKASMSGQIRLENRMATEEGMAGEPIEFGTNKNYTLREGYEGKDVLQIITIPDDGGGAEKMFNMLLQFTQLESGMVSAGDHSLSSLPSAGLATGIKSLDRVANTLLKNVFFDLIVGIEETLEDCVVLVLSYYDEVEAVRLMGREQATVLMLARDLDLLHYHVKLMLSNAKDADTLSAMDRALQLLMSYESLPPEAKERYRPIFEKYLKTLQIDDAGDKLEPGLIPDKAQATAPQPSRGASPEALAALAGDLADRNRSAEPKIVEPANAAAPAPPRDPKF